MEPEIFASAARRDPRDGGGRRDCVLAHVVFHAKGAGSGIEMSDDAWHLWRIKDGLAIEFSYFNDRE